MVKSTELRRQLHLCISAAAEAQRSIPPNYALALAQLQGARRLVAAISQYTQVTMEEVASFQNYAVSLDERIQMLQRLVHPPQHLPAATEPRHLHTDQSESEASAISAPESPREHDLPAVPSTALPPVAQQVATSSPAAPVDIPKSAPPARAPPSGGGELDTSRSSYGAQSSQTVLRAVEVATDLLKTGRRKHALDVLHHAIATAEREKNRPSNYIALEEIAQEQRRAYLTHNAPRPLQDNSLHPAEQQLLQSVGRTNRLLLPLWDDPDEGYARENVFLPSLKGEIFVDEFTPALAPAQRGAEFQRLEGDTCVFDSADPMHIKQTVVSDCSLVCSLIVIAAFQKRFPKSDIIRRVIYPQGEATRLPVVNPRGKYCVKMLINGATRCIVVDDRIPTLPNGQIACSYSTVGGELWVSLLEKAFVKVLSGTYDFGGSSSSNDLYMLSGWLPEIVTFRNDTFDVELQWRRVMQNHTSGCLLATANTPEKMSAVVEEKLKLVSGHAYAVLDVQEVDGHRLLKIKNPWARRSWEGLFNLNDGKRCTPELLDKLQFTESEAAQGIFWLSWTDLITFFDSLHLSWNPYFLFPTPQGGARKPQRVARHTVHSGSLSIGESPQFDLYFDDSVATRVHLVLSRHVRDSAEFKEASSVVRPYIAVHVFDVSDYGRRRVFGSELPSACWIHNGQYIDAVNQTVSFTVPPRRRRFTIVVAVHRPDGSPAVQPFSFTLTAHVAPTTKVCLDEQTAGLLSVRQSLRSEWVRNCSCGGRAGMQTFVYNPQFRFKLDAPGRVAVSLHSDVDEAINVYLVKSGAQDETVPWAGRVGSISKSTADVALSGPVYSRHAALVDSQLPECWIIQPAPSDSELTLNGQVVPVPGSFKAALIGQSALSLISLLCFFQGTVWPSRVVISGVQVNQSSTWVDLQFDPWTGALSCSFETAPWDAPELGTLSEELLTTSRKLFAMARVQTPLSSDDFENLTSLLKKSQAQSQTPATDRLVRVAEACVDIFSALKRAAAPKLDAGTYTVIASCWARSPGRFTLHVDTDTPTSLQPVPPEGQDWKAVHSSLTVPRAPAGAGEAQAAQCTIRLKSPAHVFCRALFLDPDAPDVPRKLSLSIAQQNGSRVAQTPFSVAPSVLAPKGATTLCVAVSILDAPVGAQGKFLLRFFSPGEISVV